MPSWYQKVDKMVPSLAFYTKIECALHIGYDMLVQSWHSFCNKRPRLGQGICIEWSNLAMPMIMPRNTTMKNVISKHIFAHVW